MKRSAWIDAVMAEQEHQFEKFGRQDHDDAFWACILVEEVGEVARSVIEKEREENLPSAIIPELIQVAAVCFTWLESFSRRLK